MTADMFGETITRPTVALKSLVNAAWGFNEFWQCLPPHPRKTGKQQALNVWAKLGCAADATHIKLYTEWLKTQDDWIRGFMPLPTTFLRRQGWIDWEPIEIKVKPERHSELDKLDNDAKQRAKPSLETLAKIAQLRKKAAA